MARESGRNDAELKEEIARSRLRVAREVRGLCYELDFPRKIRRSFQRQTLLWIGAAAAVGLLLTIAPARRKKVYVDLKSARKPAGKLLEAGFLLGALKITASLLKPVIVSFLKKKISAYASESRTLRKW